MPRPDPHRTDSVVRRIVVVHAFVTFLALGVAAALPFLTHFALARYLWSALLASQKDAFSLCLALAAADARTRLIAFLACLLYSCSVSSVWFWLSGYGTLDSEVPSQAINDVLWLLPLWAALTTMRPLLGVIRRASPLPSATPARFTLRHALVLTTLAALMLTCVKAVSALPGYEGYQSAVLVSSFAQVFTTVGLALVFFGTRRRWLGVLLWLLAFLFTLAIWCSDLATQYGWTIALEAMPIWVIETAMSLAILAATLWPLRRAGYRLTPP